MANFDFDQAEGLRRMLAGPKPRIVTFLSATPQDDKGAMLVNLGASLARAGNDVLLVDACRDDYGVAQRLGVDKGAGLLQVARQDCATAIENYRKYMEKFGATRAWVLLEEPTELYLTDMPGYYARRAP